MEDKITKIRQLRNNEYYCMQEVQDYLYAKALQNINFYDLIRYIISDNNIRLAYRNIKNNDGSKAKGISGKNLKVLGNLKLLWYLKLIKNKINNYQPQKIRRVGIPKSNGKIRYLGIQEPEEKIIEQALYQILSPICQAKFHNNSNGFIEGRSCKRAIAQMESYVIKQKLYFVADIDIKGFFDNINQGKLLKQLWTLGIRDKRLISIISKILKAEVLNVGIPEKGTPQGGILSPLLANVVLNELDWWLESKKAYGIRFVRYADDFKILCPTYSVARNMLDKTIDWLKERLKLKVSEEKTKIVNLKKNYSEFLGIKIKVKEHKGKMKITSHMRDKAIENTKIKLKNQIRVVRKNKNNLKKLTKSIELYNSKVIGIQNYYNVATQINEDLSSSNWIQNKYMIRYFKGVLTSNKSVNKNYIVERYGSKIYFIRGKPIAPIGQVNYEQPRYKGNKVNYYTETGRKGIHKELGLENTFMIQKILETPLYGETLELNDNVISKFCGQLGKTAITNKIIFSLENISIVKKHHRNDNSYNNILITEKEVAKLLVINEKEDVTKIKNKLTSEQLSVINEIRKENNLSLI